MAVEKLTPEERRVKYIEMLKVAKAAENQAIQIPGILMALAPAEDLSKLLEIQNDENDHDAIYTDLLFKAVTGNPEGAMNTIYHPTDTADCLMELDCAIAELEDGGPGSGNHGHEGRPGQHGGSKPTKKKKKS